MLKMVTQEEQYRQRKTQGTIPSAREQISCFSKQQTVFPQYLVWLLLLTGCTSDGKRKKTQPLSQEFLVYLVR